MKQEVLNEVQLLFRQQFPKQVLDPEEEAKEKFVKELQQ